MFVQNALQLLPKLCFADANYVAFVKLGGVEETAKMVSRYMDEGNAVVCMDVLQRVYCRVSPELGGLPFSDIETVVWAMERHGVNGALQQTACAAECRTCARRARRRLGELDGGSSPLAWAIVRCFAALRSTGRS